MIRKKNKHFFLKERNGRLAITTGMGCARTKTALLRGRSIVLIFIRVGLIDRRGRESVVPPESRKREPLVIALISLSLSAEGGGKRISRINATFVFSVNFEIKGKSYDGF